jgi:hypothetical protein
MKKALYCQRDKKGRFTHLVRVLTNERLYKLNEKDYQDWTFDGVFDEPQGESITPHVDEKSCNFRAEK